MPNYIGKKPGMSGIYGPDMANRTQKYSISNMQASFGRDENNLQNGSMNRVIKTKVSKQVSGLDGFGTHKSGLRPIRTTGGK